MIRVLLVEDDKNLCFILKSSLEQMIGGYEVTPTAGRGWNCWSKRSST